MVFPSVPVYLDPPNWHQQLPNQQQGQGLVLDGNESSPHHEHHQLPPLPPPPHASSGARPSSSSIRPGSMSERARLAQIPQPEPGLKCPRCESTNTKFCYFNNYSLTQPRHFCKACRRYWTRGGALRSVPVGGGCRRNKKSKSGSSQSNSGGSSSSTKAISGSSSTLSTSTPLPSTIISQYHHPSQLPFMGSLHNLAQFQVGNLGLNFSGLEGHDHMGFNSAGLMSNNNSIIQVPFFDLQGTSLFPFQYQGGIINEATGPTSITTSSTVSDDQMVKMEERVQGGGVNLPRQLLGASENSHYWQGGGTTSSWTDLSGLN